MIESFTPSAQVYRVDMQDDVCKIKKTTTPKHCTKTFFYVTYHFL